MAEPAGLRLALTAAYVASALLALLAATRASRRERSFWLVTAVILAVLAAAKQLHLQEVATDTGRAIARAAGFYAWHRPILAVFVVAVAAVALGMLGWLSGSVRRGSSSVTLAVAGIVFLAALLVIRAASLHGFDLWLSAQAAGLPRSWWCELIGLGVIDAAAFGYRRGGYAARS